MKSNELPVTQVMFAPVARATAISGLSRAAIYRAAKAGKIRLRKLGRSTLVDMETVRAFIESLPVAVVKRKDGAVGKNQ